MGVVWFQHDSAPTCTNIIIQCDLEPFQIYTRSNTNTVVRISELVQVQLSITLNTSICSEIFPQLSRLGQIRMRKHHKTHDSQLERARQMWRRSNKGQGTLGQRALSQIQLAKTETLCIDNAKLINLFTFIQCRVARSIQMYNNIRRMHGVEYIPDSIHCY